MSNTDNREAAVLGGGCFWCLEAVYQRVEGVESVVSGYAGGETENPDYETVSTGRTGHAEVVEIKYNPEVISYKEILDIFWKAHDPTTLNRQGADRGTQYRSIILTNNEEEARIARESKEKADESGEFKDPIVTEIIPLTKFYPAEGYHQDYYNRNSQAPYCRVVISPKLSKLNLHL